MLCPMTAFISAYSGNTTSPNSVMLPSGAIMSFIASCFQSYPSCLEESPPKCLSTDVYEIYPHYSKIILPPSRCLPKILKENSSPTAFNAKQEHFWGRLHTPALVAAALFFSSMPKY